MPESYASSEDLGFVALSLPTGGSIWLAAASIYAVETHPSEDFTMVKTVGEAIGVTERPQVIFDSIEALQRNSEHRTEQREVAKFADFVMENEITVYGVEDEPAYLQESDKRMKEIRARGLASNERGERVPDNGAGGLFEQIQRGAQIISNPVGKDGKLSKEALTVVAKDMGISIEEAEKRFSSEIEDDEYDYDALSDDALRRKLLEHGVDSGTIETIIARRADDRFDQDAEQEFGEDLSSVMERMRQRDEEAGRG